MINQFEINSAGLVDIVASGTLVEIASETVSIASGDLIALQQSVGIHAASDDVSTIEQITTFKLVAAGELIGLEQRVVVTGNGSLVSLEQNCVNKNKYLTHLGRTGWDLVLSLDGAIVDNSKIHGQIQIVRSENSASSMVCTMLPDSGPINLQYYPGKRITLDAIVPGGLYRVFTGIVDLPDLDIINKKITLRCSDRRTEQINSQLRGAIGTIGYYSDIVFQSARDTAEELDNRLSTTPYSVDFDAFGNYTLTSWYAKNTPDYTLDNSSVFYRQPKVELASRTRIINKVNVNFQYRYQRLHHVKRHFTWESPVADDIMLMLNWGYGLTPRQLVDAAVNGAKWPLQGNITYTPIWPSGWYGGIAWSTGHLSGVTSNVLDSNGNPVYDSGGNPVMQVTNTSFTDYSSILCMGAQWDATKRFSQTITESLNLVVRAPQSEAQYDTIESDLAYSADTDFDTSIWENYESYNDTGNGNNNYYIDVDTTRSSYNNGVITALAKAQTSILATHRDTKVTVQTALMPQIDLKHTLKIDTNLLEAKGKVYSIVHNFDIGTGDSSTEIQISLFKSQGSTSTTGLYVPSQGSDSVIYPTNTIVLGNHFGQDPSQPGAENWNGYIGNAMATMYSARTNYAERFIVDTPNIPDSLRQERGRSAGATYIVALPNDLLNINI